MTNKQDDARRDVVAAVRAVLDDDEISYRAIVDNADDTKEVAEVAIGLAATLMAVLPDSTAKYALDAFMWATIRASD